MSNYDDSIIWFGKHKGQPWDSEEVETEYLEWLAGTAQKANIRTLAVAEVKRRGGSVPESSRGSDKRTTRRECDGCAALGKRVAKLESAAGIGAGTLDDDLVPF